MKVTNTCTKIHPNENTLLFTSHQQLTIVNFWRKASHMIRDFSLIILMNSLMRLETNSIVTVLANVVCWPERTLQFVSSLFRLFI